MAYRSFVPVLLLLGACAQEAPRLGRVVTMSPHDARTAEGAPEPGTVWRLDEAALRALSPAPLIEPPPPPRRPPPRPNDPAPDAYYGPYFGPSWSHGFEYWPGW